ncbi:MULTISPECIES: tyrosine-type recombinase/integrase [unclassified Dehalobacter]|jgi:Site-specific recombinase XerC|uniref:tyrosine-type recombinase/integrase n=1 Tax=unclassified Dehalobacter TaxID=2635733 RepID=UPI00028B0F88|nr:MULTISPECIES: tyrosine-type recombinase/integrase [unclassified Dehalobacter]AFV01208.1 phage integrase [Dehalobacter sp. DCA]AFV04247.1 phage integrase [Dehalobacter sp. CF]
MSVAPRQVKNKRNQDGVSTSRTGTVYDVFIRYKTDDGYKTYGKRGFATKQEALSHEAEMRTKLTKPGYQPLQATKSKQTMKEYLETWVENHGKANLRPSTFAGYKSHIKNHILPFIGNVPLKQLTPAMIDNMFQKLFDKKLSQSTVRYAQRILSVALEAARKYHYIETNPARDIITKFGKQGKTPDPYTVEQMQRLMGNCVGTEWEMIIVLSGMYGLRRNEVLGLRWDNVDLQNKTFSILEQLPYKVPPGTMTIMEMAPTKSNDRVLPITETTLPYFVRQLVLQHKQKELAQLSGQEYYDNSLVIAKPNGAPLRADRVSSNFGQMLRHLEMPHIRFHDLRHSAATNMHQLTGDFYTVGEILGHTLKGIGISLGISTNLEAVTAQYVNVRLDRKKTVLDAYHNALHPQEIAKAASKKPKKMSRNMER